MIICRPQCNHESLDIAMSCLQMLYISRTFKDSRSVHSLTYHNLLQSPFLHKQHRLFLGLNEIDSSVHCTILYIHVIDLLTFRVVNIYHIVGMKGITTELVSFFIAFSIGGVNCPIGDLLDLKYPIALAADFKYVSRNQETK